MSVTPYEKYRNDTRFYALVTNMVDMIEAGLCDYHMLQEASMVASVKHCQIHGYPVSPILHELLSGKEAT